MFNSGGALKQANYDSKKTGTINLRIHGCGSFGAYSSLKPKRIIRDSTEKQDFNYDQNSGLLTLDLPVADTELYSWNIAIELWMLGTSIQTLKDQKLHLFVCLWFLSLPFLQRLHRFQSICFILLTSRMDLPWFQKFTAGLRSDHTVRKSEGKLINWLKSGRYFSAVGFWGENRYDSLIHMQLWKRRQKTELGPFMN